MEQTRVKHVRGLCVRRIASAVVLLFALAACESTDSTASGPTAVVVAPTMTVPPAPTPPPDASPSPTPVPAPSPTPVPAPSPTPVLAPTPPSHPWYECEFIQYALIGVDYRVTNIPADDPDGGLVAHTAPGIAADVTEVLPDGENELNVAACQQNPSSGSVWWLVEDRGWVNAHYLEAYSPAGSPDWIPGLTNALPAEFLPDVVGLEGDSLEELRQAIVAAIVVEPFTTVELDNFLGVDARGGIARLDIIGIGDDSIGGYRLELTIDFIKDDSATDILGYRIVSTVGYAICSRGVTADGDLCV